MADQRDDWRQTRGWKGSNLRRRSQIKTADFKIALEKGIGFVAADGVAKGGVSTRAEVVAVEHPGVRVETPAGLEVGTAAAAERRCIEIGVVTEPV